MDEAAEQLEKAKAFPLPNHVNLEKSFGPRNTQNLS